MVLILIIRKDKQQPNCLKQLKVLMELHRAMFHIKFKFHTKHSLKNKEEILK